LNWVEGELEFQDPCGLVSQVKKPIRFFLTGRIPLWLAVESHPKETLLDLESTAMLFHCLVCSLEQMLEANLAECLLQVQFVLPLKIVEVEIKG